MSGVTISGAPINPLSVQRIVQEELSKATHSSIARLQVEVMSRAARHRRTGHLMRNIHHKVTPTGKGFLGLVGTDVFYAKYLEIGTGLYGPRNRWIVPIRARFLRFPQPGNAGFTLAGRQRSGRAGAGASWVYARRVRGIRPLRIFRDAAIVNKPIAERIFVTAQQRIIVRVATGIKEGTLR